MTLLDEPKYSCYAKTRRKEPTRLSQCAAVQGVGSLLVMLPLLCSSFSDTFGMALEPCSEMFLLVEEEDRAGKTGFEPATSGVTDQHSNQLSYFPLLYVYVQLQLELLRIFLEAFGEILASNCEVPILNWKGHQRTLPSLSIYPFHSATSDH
jgi:hypothetical protein